MPLNKEQLSQIKGSIIKAEAALKDATGDITLAKRAGVDVADQETHANELRVQIRKMKAVYG